MKTCSKCKLEKEFSEFSKQKKGKNGLRSSCKECIKIERKIYVKENKEKIYVKTKRYNLDNYEIKKEKRKEYNKINKDKINVQRNKYKRDKKLNNPLFKLSCNISTLIYVSVKNQGYTKKSKTYEILGCSFEHFKAHLENQFIDGMTWENQGLWHMDHIYPVSRATDEEHLIKLNHYTNFQPLWAEDNIKKSNKIIKQIK